MALSYAGLVGLDFRGAQANVAEQLAWLAPLPANATSEQKAGACVIAAERRKLLAGKSSFSAYLEARREEQRREKAQ